MPLLLLCLLLGDVITDLTNVTPPRLINRTKLKYSSMASKARIQGTVVLQLVITPEGKPSDIVIVSPLGFGLDEQALAAVEKWRFQPAVKDGKPVAMRAIIEANFRVPGEWFDEKAERRRTDYNVAIKYLQDPNVKDKASEVKTMQELARKQLPAAMCVVSTWMREGRFLPKDLQAAERLEREAVAKNDAMCMCELGKRLLESGAIEKGLPLLRDAATLGNRAAQFYLGGRYESGQDVEQDQERAQRYFRLCGAAGEAACQFRVGRLLLSDSSRSDRDLIEGVAWLELAAEKDLAPARELLDKEQPGLTPEQRKQIQDLKSHLIRKP